MDLASPAERVAATVRAELARRRLTQTDLARALGLTRSTLHRRMTGEQAFNVDELHDVADFLGVPVTALFVDERTVPAA